MHLVQFLKQTVNGSIRFLLSDDDIGLMKFNNNHIHFDIINYWFEHFLLISAV